MTMRGSIRLIALAVALALSGVLAGCSTANFDPTDLLDFLDTKKKLPGERKPVFPEGVPGLEQGVPKDLYRGSRQQQLDEQNVALRTEFAPDHRNGAICAESPRLESAAVSLFLNSLPSANQSHFGRKRLGHFS